MPKKKSTMPGLDAAITALYPEQAGRLLAQIESANLTAETLHNAPVLMKETCGVDVYEMIKTVRQYLADPPKETVRESSLTAHNPAGKDQPNMEV